MRVIAAATAVTLCVAACGSSPAPEPGPPSTSTVPSNHSAPINPARIDRARVDVPPGYEVADIAGRTAPLALWGFGPAWEAQPSQCGVLGDPVVDPASMAGWSASGEGGIVYAVVASGAAPLDPAVPAECGQWDLSAGHTSGTVTLQPAPSIHDAATLGMATAATTVVEGGTATRSQADTFVAYAGEHLVFVTVVTDPGSPLPSLGADFAGDLLVKTVSALRG